MNWKTAVSQIERTYTTKGRQQSGFYSIEGVRLIERAVRAGAPLAFIIISEQVANSESERERLLCEQLTAAHIPLIVVADDEMTRLTNGRSLGGLIGLLPTPARPPLAELLQNTARPLLVTAVEIIDPGNVGAMIRTAHGLGAHALIAVGSSDPYHPKAVRTSMGSLFKLPIVQYTAVSQLLADLNALGIMTVGTAVDTPHCLPLHQPPQQGVALFIGNEYHGLPATILAQLDLTIAIPMADGIDSLSVNAATAIMVYELSRH